MRIPSNAQREAICHVYGPAILIAGPGSGKTFTIVNRLKYMIRDKAIPPENILVVTFSKAAAREMQERFLKENEVYGVHFGTFHSLAYYILRNSFGFDTGSLLNDSQKRSMLSQTFKNHGYNDICNLDFLSNILNEISRNKNSNNYNEVKINSTNDNISSDKLNDIISDYLSFLKEMNKIDFDDMIILCIEKLLHNKHVLNEYQKMFKYILVDEFQDINLPQYDLIKLLSEGTNNLFVVGDDDQAIYKFRGSTPGIMKTFINDYKNAKKIMLTDNYRSGASIVNFASKVIENNPNRFNKVFNPINDGGKILFNEFLSRKEEEDYIVNLLNTINYEELNETAIILRTNMEVNLYAATLKKSGIIVEEQISKNKSIFDTFIFEDIVNYLKYIYEGNYRRYLLPILNKPNKYIRPIAFNSEIVDDNLVSKYYNQNIEMLKCVQDFFRYLKLASKMNVSMAISIFRKSIGYDRYIKTVSRNNIEFENNLSIIGEIEAFFKDYHNNISIDAYIEDNNSFNVSNESIIKNGVKIITMHTSKGLEFKNVILPDVNEGVIPSKRCEGLELEEERRLLYVAITRAKENLYILSNNERNRTLSRFIKGIVKENSK